MDAREQPFSEQPTSLLTPPPSDFPAGGKSGSQHRGRTALIAFLTFILGIIVALTGVATFFFLYTGNQNDRKPVPVVKSTQNGAIVAQVSTTYITQVVQANVKSSGMPGTISNVQVSLNQGDEMTVQGDDQLTLAFLSVTKHFTLVLQTLADSCHLSLHVIHADLEGIPVTGFVAAFEGQLNQQVQSKAPNFPDGFTYCMSQARTEPQALFITYTATPA